jgi:ectoine hydroxylase-related dioxygenase (phytanoyl-CoA dioxygenase family)
MPHLSETQRDAFWRDGWLLVEDAVDAELLADLRRDFAAWVEESRERIAPWGETVDQRPRFDLERKSHSADHPALRRVNSPTEVSEAYRRAMASSRMTEIVAELIGPNVKFHHSKINSKLPGAATEVKWHQDFPFTPHSNDDIITALLFVDEVTADNGPLEIVPGSHLGPIHSLWKDDTFAAAVADEVAAESQKKAVRCLGPAGACCFMHTRLLHGSAPNRTGQPRTLFISVYSSEDAVPLSPNPVPSSSEGLIVAGRRTGAVRSVPFDLRLPQLPSTASFFDQQDTAAAPPKDYTF